MSVRSWIALLLLLNYLLLVGAGCMNQPEDPHELVLVQSSADEHHYQQCRYLRMDALETFLIEALASRYQNAPETPRHHLLVTVSGVDAHQLPASCWPVFLPAPRLGALVRIRRGLATESGVSRMPELPPDGNKIRA